MFYLNAALNSVRSARLALAQDLNAREHNTSNPEGVWDNFVDSTTYTITEDMVDMAAQIFGDSIDWADVRILENGLFLGLQETQNGHRNERPWVFSNTITWSGEYDPNDPEDRRTLIHELVHIWQYQTFGLDYYLSNMSTNGDYDYTLDQITAALALDPGQRLTSFGMEEMAEVVSDYYALQALQNGELTGGQTIELRFLGAGAIDVSNANIDADGNLIYDGVTYDLDRLFSNYETIVNDLHNGLAEHPDDFLPESIDQLGQGALNTMYEVGEATTEVKDEVREAIQEISEAEGFWDTTGEVIEGAGEIIWELGEGIVETGVALGEGIFNTAVGLGEDIANGVEAGINAIGDGVEAIGDAVEEGLETIGDGVEAIGDAVEDGLEAVGDAVEEGAEAVGGAIASGAESVWNNTLGRFL